MMYYMPQEFQNYNRKTKITNMQLFSDYISGWSKEPQWENNYNSFLPFFLLVVGLSYQMQDPTWKTSNEICEMIITIQIRSYLTWIRKILGI